MTRQSRVFAGEVSYLMIQMGAVSKQRNDAIGSATEQSRQAKIFEVCIGFPKGKLDPLKQEESSGCDPGVVPSKVADVKGDINSLVACLRQDTCDSYASFRHIVDQSFVEVSEFVKEMFHGAEKALRQCARDSLCNAACGVQKSFVDALEVVN